MVFLVDYLIKHVLSPLVDPTQLHVEHDLLGALGTPKLLHLDQLRLKALEGYSSIDLR